MKFKYGDNVRVISGPHKGQVGKCLFVKAAEDVYWPEDSTRYSIDKRGVNWFREDQLEALK